MHSWKAAYQDSIFKQTYVAAYIYGAFWNKYKASNPQTTIRCFYKAQNNDFTRFWDTARPLIN